MIDLGHQGLYVGVDAHGLHLGGGMFEASKEQVERLRQAIADEGTGAALAKTLTGLRKRGYQVGGDQLKRVPKPWDDSHPRADLLKHKSLIAWIDHDPEPWLHTPAAKDHVVAAWRALKPLNAWLADNVG